MTLHLYREIKDALQAQIIAHLNSLNEKVDVYGVPYQSIAVFPAVALELEGRRKVKVGLGVRELQLGLVIWVYTDILDAEDAEDECLRILEIVEEAVEKDKTLNGTADYLDIDDNAEFGTVQQGEVNFLQGAKLRVNIRKRITI